MKKLITFDLDGTLTTRSTWEGFNALLGLTAEVDQQLFDLYKSGELTYLDWIGAIATIYKESGKKITRADVENFALRVELRAGARAAIDAAFDKGYKVIITSSAIDTVARAIGKSLGIATIFTTNEAVYDEDDVLTDLDTMGDERVAKFAMLEAYVQEHNYDIAEVIAVGGGGNDLHIFDKTKGILIGESDELEPVMWKKVKMLSEVEKYL